MANPDPDFALRCQPGRPVLNVTLVSERKMEALGGGPLGEMSLPTSWFSPDSGGRKQRESGLQVAPGCGALLST